MQIPPSQWIGAAASAIPQQASKQNTAARAGNVQAISLTTEQVAKGDQAQDRDANGQYDGNTDPRRDPKNPSSEPPTPPEVRLKEIELAAENPEPPSEFESWG